MTLTPRLIGIAADLVTLATAGAAATARAHHTMHRNVVVSPTSGRSAP